jgi:hypothetical protein
MQGYKLKMMRIEEEIQAYGLACKTSVLNRKETLKLFLSSGRLIILHYLILTGRFQVP